ncbi:hypothetical protein AAFF_G00416150 [Aldrovandia affinis]|uniref:Uncharacterized protein n=1 Tax=Aldrovandia affinis TaxID=143900 RepID=A0AAD7SAR3_9TELE|nr:hypothetical protein AAFF_G00416150 [Aldrovandia affinis]
MKTLQKDMEDLKESMNGITIDMATLMKQQSAITDLLSEIKQLKWQNMEQAKKIVELENRVADLEQYSRTNDVIITGLAIRPRNYAQATKGATSVNGVVEHEETTEEQMAPFHSSICLKGLNSVCPDQTKSLHPVVQLSSDP